jgi:hypothetical protein
VLDLLLGSGRQNRWRQGDRYGAVILCPCLVYFIEFFNLAMMSAEDLVEGRRHILQEMKSVGDLGGLWSSLPNACGIGFCSVTGDYVDIGMVLEPRSNGFRRPILKQVDGTTAFEIHDDRAVAMAFAPRPIIDANDVRLCLLRQSDTPHAPQQRSAAHWCTLTCQMSSPSGAA